MRILFSQQKNVNKQQQKEVNKQQQKEVNKCFYNFYKQKIKKFLNYKIIQKHTLVALYPLSVIFISMIKEISFSAQDNTFNDNVFTFNEDQDQPDKQFQSSKSIPFSITPTQQQTYVNQQNQQQNAQPNQIFTFDDDDEEQIVQNQSYQNSNHRLPTQSQFSTITQQTQTNQQITQDLTYLKNKILSNQQNNLLYKNTDTLKLLPHSKHPKLTSEPELITKSFENKVNKLRESLKENNQKEPVLKKNVSQKSSLKNKCSQQNLRRSPNNFLKFRNSTNDQSHFEGFKQNKPEEQGGQKYEIQGAKIVTGEDKNNQQFEYVEEQKAIKVTNLRQFLFTQLAEQYKVNALITRVEDGGFFEKLVNKTKYIVTIEENNKFLFSVTKDGFNKFIFSMNKDDCSQKKKNYLGQLVSNDFSNTQFILYDNGFDPKQTKCLQYSFKQMASIKYEEGSGPKKFSVLISTNNKGFHTIESEINILDKKWSEKKERKNLCKLYSKEPEFDESDGNYKLDFKGMIGKPSVKNFVLSSDDYQDCLIFARRNNTYALEVKHPFSLIQAVAVCMSSIYHKTIL